MVVLPAAAGADVVLGAHQSLRGPSLGVGSSHPAEHPASGHGLGALHPELAVHDGPGQVLGDVAEPVRPKVQNKIST